MMQYFITKTCKEIRKTLFIKSIFFCGQGSIKDVIHPINKDWFTFRKHLNEWLRLPVNFLKDYNHDRSSFMVALYVTLWQQKKKMEIQNIKIATISPLYSKIMLVVYKSARTMNGLWLVRMKALQCSTWVTLFK